MQEHAVELNALLWPAGWLVAVLLLFAVGLRLPLATGLGGVGQGSMRQAVSSLGSACGGWQSVALVLNDTHIDLTREKVYTPSADAIAVVDELNTQERRGVEPVGVLPGQEHPPHQRVQTAAETGKLILGVASDETNKAAVQKQIEDWQKTAARYRSEPETGEGTEQLAARSKHAEHERDDATAKYHHFTTRPPHSRSASCWRPRLSSPALLRWPGCRAS